MGTISKLEDDYLKMWGGKVFIFWSDGLKFMLTVIPFFNDQYESCVLMQVTVGKNSLCKDTNIFTS